MALQYNKLYQSLKKVSAEWHAGHVEYSFYWNYLKFYENGTVIEASVNSENFKKIDDNFHTDNPNVSKGIFHYDNKEIKINIDNSNLVGGASGKDHIVLQGQKNLNWDLFKIVS